MHDSNMLRTFDHVTSHIDKAVWEANIELVTSLNLGDIFWSKL